MRWGEAAARALALVLLTAALGVMDAAAQQSRAGELGSALERAAEARALKRATDQYDETFRKYAKRYFGPNFDWKVFKAQALAESSLNPDAASPVGARGLMQLMPSTYQMIQSRTPELGSIDDPEWNIAAGIQHDRYLWKLWSKEVAELDRPSFMFASYNAGEGTITRATTVAREQNLDHAVWSNIETVAPNVRRWRYLETLGYVRRIERYYELLRVTR
jgi:membrane-bound lytic murein transglycosylase F